MAPTVLFIIHPSGRNEAVGEFSKHKGGMTRRSGDGKGGRSGG